MSSKGKTLQSMMDVNFHINDNKNNNNKEEEEEVVMIVEEEEGSTIVKETIVIEGDEDDGEEDKMEICNKNKHFRSIGETDVNESAETVEDKKKKKKKKVDHWNVIDMNNLDFADLFQYIPKPTGMKVITTGNEGSVLHWNNSFYDVPICNDLQFESMIVFYKLPSSFDSSRVNITNYTSVKHAFVAYKYHTGHKRIKHASKNRLSIPCSYSFPVTDLSAGNYLAFVVNKYSNNTIAELITLYNQTDIENKDQKQQQYQHANKFLIDGVIEDSCTFSRATLLEYPGPATKLKDIKTEYNTEYKIGMIEVTLPNTSNSPTIEFRLEIADAITEPITSTVYKLKVILVNEAKFSKYKLYLRNLPNGKYMRTTANIIDNAGIKYDIVGLDAEVIKVSGPFADTLITSEFKKIHESYTGGADEYGLNNDEITCSICLNAIDTTAEEGDKAQNPDGCTHVFHESCLTKWAASSEKKECTTCKTKYRETFFTHLQVDFLAMDPKKCKTFKAIIGRKGPFPVDSRSGAPYTFPPNINPTSQAGRRHPISTAVMPRDYVPPGQSINLEGTFGSNLRVFENSGSPIVVATQQPNIQLPEVSFAHFLASAISTLFNSNPNTAGRGGNRTPR